MINGRVSPDGALFVLDETAPPGTTCLGGQALTPVGVAYVANNILAAPPYYFPNGFKTDVNGTLIIGPGPIIGYKGGYPYNANDELVVQLNQPVSPGDAWVAGIRVGPLGGVYIIDVVPPTLGGYSNGFSNGFDVYDGSPIYTFSPADLFANGEQGAWYDPSDLTTMFQDRAGTTPVTADGQTVGKVLDKSGRGNHATAPSDAARPLYKTDGTYHWMQFDGVDDGLATANIDMSASPQMLYSIGCRNIAGASDDFLFEFGTSYNALGGCYYIAPSGYANLNLGGSPVGGDYSSCWAVSSELVYGSDFVLSNQIDRTQVGILLEQNIMVNGVDVPPSNPIGSDSGAGNCGVLTLNIGARSNGATGNINARVYQVVMVSGLPSIQERNNLDTWVGIKTGSYGGALVGDIGDSTVAEYGGVPAVVSLIQGAHGNQLAEPGNTISQQQTKWDAQTPAVQQSYQAVVIQASLNDITPSEAAVVVIGRLQTLVNTVVSDTLPNCVVLIATLTPCKARLISLFGAVDGEIAYQSWLSVNEAISGSGATPITGVDGRITSHTVTMNDGSGNLKGIYDSGDGIHPNAAGKQVIADSWRAELVSQGVLS